MSRWVTPTLARKHHRTLGSNVQIKGISAPDSFVSISILDAADMQTVFVEATQQWHLRE